MSSHTSSSHTTYGDERSGRLAREAVHRHWSGSYAANRHVDVGLLLAALALSAYGLVMIYSATLNGLEAQGADASSFVNRQLVALGIGIVAAAAVVAVDYRVYRAWAPVLYGLSIVLLIATIAMGTVVNASRSWIVIGGFQMQPAEFAKPALIVMLAALFHERREEALGLRALVEALVLAAIPMGLILLQPDFGTFMVFVAIVFGVLLLARVRIRYMIALAAIGLVAIFGALQLGLVQDYQIARLTSFLNPAEADELGAAYNVNQAQIAIGSGQFTGQGLFQGSQTGLSYVPENHTDFIFTVVGEELGFLGSIVLLGLYAIVLWRGIRIAALSKDTLGTLLAGGVVAVIAFQVFINIGMSVGIMPVTGLPLPFVSYGGTSLIGSFIMIGLLQNVHMRRFQ